jgi:hypothetical protein
VPAARGQKTRKSVLAHWKSGHGQGEGIAYKPWFKTRNVPSHGERNRIKGIKNDRLHHLVSKLERHYFYILDWSLDVTDIREQFPLWHFDETTELAAQLGVKSVVAPGKEVHVMTSDFVVDIEGDPARKRIRSTKYVDELKDERVLEKLEIERQYWLRRGDDWAIVTEEEIPPDLALNLELWHQWHSLEGVTIGQNERDRLIEALTKEVADERGTVTAITKAQDQAFALAPGTALTVAYHLLITRQWKVDPYKRFRPSSELELLGTELRGQDP